MKLSSFFKRVHKNIPKLHSKKKALFFSITLAGFFIVGTAVLINQKAPSSAELRFSEFSKNKDTKGSVIPASCESFPTVGPTHGTNAVPEGGHCGGTCPVNTRLTNVPFYYCNDGVNPFEWYPNGCLAPNTNDFYVGAYHLVYPLCQWAVNPACPSVYIDQACPATVDISISPSTISYGGNSSMTYTSTNASTCSFYNIRNFALWDAWDLNSWAAGAAPGAYNWDSSWGPHTASQAYLIQCANADGIVASDEAILTVCPLATPYWNGSACIAVPAPTSPTLSCNAAGNVITFSWTAAPNATRYYPRFSVPAAQPCPSGWTKWTDTTTCYVNDLVSTSITADVNTGQAYNFWVHSGTNDWVNWWTSAGDSITCPAPPAVNINFQ